METATIIMTAPAEWQLGISDILKIVKMGAMQVEEEVELVVIILQKITKLQAQAMGTAIIMSMKQRKLHLWRAK